MTKEINKKNCKNELGLFPFKIQNTNKNITQGSFFFFVIYNRFVIGQLYTTKKCLKQYVGQTIDTF